MEVVPGSVWSEGTHRPLVVLCGWLGAQPCNLRRYEELYSGMGFCVWSRVATAAMVANATFSQPPLAVPRSWPHKSSATVTNTMESLAWVVLGEIDLSTFPFVSFHVFSNSGCFLWENICSIVRLSERENNGILADPVPHPVLRRLEAIRERIMGVVFDSCPGDDLSRLPNALNFCTLEEQIRVILSTRYAFFYFPSVQREVQKRAKAYIGNRVSDAWSLPQLYLYSEDDSLAPFRTLNEFVERRKQLHGSRIIWSKVWSKSAHCSHLYHHPQEYQKSVSSFMNVCMMHNLTKHQRSRL